MIRSIFVAVVFFAATIVLSVVSIPAALFDRSGRAYLWLAQVWSKIFLLLFGIKVTLSGEEHLPKSGGVVFVANHSSYTDIPVILAGIPYPIRLILRKSLTNVPIWGWALRVSPMIIIDRSNAAKARQTLADAAETIKGGASVLLFPEGTRTGDGAMQSFKRGAFRLAYESDAAVVPVALLGTFDVLPRHKNLPASSKCVSIRIGASLCADKTIPGDREREIDLMKRAEEAVTLLME